MNRKGPFYRRMYRTLEEAIKRAETVKDRKPYFTVVIIERRCNVGPRYRVDYGPFVWCWEDEKIILRK